MQITNAKTPKDKKGKIKKPTKIKVENTYYLNG